MRLGYYLLGPSAAAEILLYVDDVLYIVESARGVAELGLLVFVLTALGVPFKWTKFRGGPSVSWVCYWADLRGFRLGVSAKRADWMRTWLDNKISEGRVEMSDFSGVLGRLCFALGPLEHARPFLAPMFAWLAAVGHRGSMILPWSVLYIMRLLREEFTEERRTIEILPRGEDIGLAFRAAAKAEGADIVVGGWECVHGTPTERARWFSVTLTRKTAPWAYSRGEPYRTIASLELFGTLLCVMVFGDAWGDTYRSKVAVTGLTDNQGHTFCIARLMTPKFPLLVVLSELAVQLRSRGMELDLFWVPRDQNEEADALTNREFSGFDPKLRVEVDVEKLAFQVLPDMLAVSEDLHNRVKNIRESAPAKEQGPRKKPQDRLRAREPW